MRDDRACLQDILEGIERIEKYASGGRDAFEGNELVQTWIMHNLLIIGEAARGPVLKKRVQEILALEA